MVTMLGWLSAEARLAPHVCHPLRRQDFDGDKTVQVRVTRFVNDAHAAFAELLDDAVMRHPTADQPGYLPIGDVQI